RSDRRCEGRSRRRTQQRQLFRAQWLARGADDSGCGWFVRPGLALDAGVHELRAAAEPRDGILGTANGSLLVAGERRRQVSPTGAAVEKSGDRAEDGEPGYRVAFDDLQGEFFWRRAIRRVHKQRAL